MGISCTAVVSGRRSPAVWYARVLRGRIWYFLLLAVCFGLPQVWVGSTAAKRSAKLWRTARLARPRPQAAITSAGKDLEEILIDAHSVADEEFSSIWNSIAQKCRDGGVPGLRAWLARLNLTDHVHAAVFWADRMGACALEEIVENFEDFANDLGLGLEAEAEAEAACRHAEEVTAVDMKRAAQRRRHMNAREADESLLYLLLNLPDRHVPFQDFDATFETTLKSLCNTCSRLASSLEESFSREVGERLKADLQYLRVMREYFALHLPLPPCLDSRNKTWTFCGGAEKWLDLAGDAAFPVTLLPLTRPVRQAMEQAVLGNTRGSRLLRTYVASESGLAGIADSRSLLQLVNSSKQLVLKAARSFAGASGLPDWNRSGSEGLVPLAIVKHPSQNKSEIALQIQKYFEFMSNTRVAQADRYFGHVLFGYLLSRLSQRFDLVQSSGLLSLNPDVQRLKLAAQVYDHQKDPESRRFSQEELQARLDDEVFEQFVRTSLDSEDSGGLMEVSPTAVQAIRRHTDQIFGRGLREEVFVPLTRASRACASNGEVAAGPEICMEFLLEAARKSELRMLSLNLVADERLMWHGLVFGALLQRHEIE